MPKPVLESGPPIQPPSRFDRRTLFIALQGSLLCYLAHPPIGWGWLAWVGPMPWCLLARISQLNGRRPYGAIWLAGAVYWLLTIQWIRLPHWANIFGLFFLAGYLGAYLPVFVGLTRVAVHRLRVPLWLAAPIAWTGLEWIRARLLTGFLMGSLAHTQVNYPQIIQIADVFGEYGVTFLIMMVAAAIAAALPQRWIDAASDASEPGASIPRSWQPVLPLVPAAVALIAAIAYGHWRIDRLDQQGRDAREVKVALIQSD